MASYFNPTVFDRVGFIQKYIEPYITQQQGVVCYASAEYLNNEESFYDYYTEAEISYAPSKAHPKSASQI